MEGGVKGTLLRSLCALDQIAALDRRELFVFVICKSKTNPKGAGFDLKEMIQICDRPSVGVCLTIALPVFYQMQMILEIARSS